MDSIILKPDPYKSLIIEGGMLKISQKKFLRIQASSIAVPISGIISIVLKRPRWFMAGYMRFRLAGNYAYRFTGRARDDEDDEISIHLLGKDEYEIALQIKQYVEDFKESNP